MNDNRYCDICKIEFPHIVISLRFSCASEKSKDTADRDIRMCYSCGKHVKNMSVLATAARDEIVADIKNAANV